MGAISSRILSRRKILSNATTERLPPKQQRKAEERAQKARRKGKPHLEITTEGYLHLVVDSSPVVAKSVATAPKGKDRGRSTASTDEASSAATTSSRPAVHKASAEATLPEDDSFYDEAFGLWPAEAAPNSPALAPREQAGGAEHSRQFHILGLEQIRVRQQNLIKRTAELLSVTQDQASLMLLYFRWRFEDLVEAYRLDPERVCNESGVRVENAQQIQDPRDEEERVRLKANFKRWPGHVPTPAPTSVPARNSGRLVLADDLAHNEASSTSSRRQTLGIDRPPTPRRPSGNRIQLQFPPVTRLVQQPADATVVEVLTDETLAPYGIDVATFNQRLASLQDIAALADTQRAVQLLLGAGCDVNIATNHFFNQELPAVDDSALRSSGSVHVVAEQQQQQQDSEPLTAEFRALDAEIEQMIAELELRNTAVVETRKQVLQIARESIRQHDRLVGRTEVAQQQPSVVDVVGSSPSAPEALAGDPHLRRVHRRDLLLRLLSGRDGVDGAEELSPAVDAPPAALPAPASASQSNAVRVPPLPISEVPAPEEIEPIEPIRLEPILSAHAAHASSLATTSAAPSAGASAMVAPLAGPSEAERAAHPGETLCLVCYCWTKDDECFSLDCGHAYCRDCWAGHLSAKLSDGPLCLHAHCMAPKCTLVVPATVWRRVVSAAHFERYESFLVKSFVSRSGESICWCPNPRSCEYAVATSAAVATDDDKTGPPVAHCRCGFAFCWGCKEERHVPITCEQLSAWLQQCSSEKANGVGEWIIANAKPCPGCKAPIEKNEGCMHMTCVVCGHEFCWLCRAAWNTHGEQTGGYFACNRYATSEAKVEDDNNENRKSQLRRFLHYYERYAQHHRSKEIAAKILDAAPARLQEFTARYPHTPISNFFLEAATLVQDCRGVLKNTYAFAYFLPLRETPEKRLFEYLQANLEATTEKLTELVEQPLDKLDADAVVSYTKATRRFLENLLQGLQTGLTYNQPFVATWPKKGGKQRKQLSPPADSAPPQLPALPE